MVSRLPPRDTRPQACHPLVHIQMRKNQILCQYSKKTAVNVFLRLLGKGAARRHHAKRHFEPLAC